ncbi:MAG: hypothetical protein KJ621_08515 [Proteobacteria bacterium]|nr:hypothetical protein [Pseudomonadota bacterium]
MDFERTKRREWSWTEFRDGQARAVGAVVDELADYWPLTPRQIHYRLVSLGYRENTRSQYNDLSKLVKQMRVDGLLGWGVVADNHRRMSDKRGFEDSADFLDRIARYLDNYARCLIQGQENYIETWCEKEALAGVFEAVAWPYCIRHVTCKGLPERDIPSPVPGAGRGGHGPGTEARNSVLRGPRPVRGPNVRGHHSVT